MRVFQMMTVALAGLVIGVCVTHLWQRRHMPLCQLYPTVIIGDSNVFQMDLGPNCVNLGVGSNTTKDMAARFTVKDIAALHRPALVIWTPSNEVHAQTGDGVRYIRQMAEQARAAGMRVILTTPLPMIDNALLPPRGHLSQVTVDAEIATLASQVNNLGRQEHFPVADVHAVTVIQDGSIKRSLFSTDNDGTIIHLNPEGLRTVWRVMYPIIRR